MEALLAYERCVVWCFFQAYCHGCREYEHVTHACMLDVYAKSLMWCLECHSVEALLIGKGI
jgi:hypothetical protein